MAANAAGRPLQLVQPVENSGYEGVHFRFNSGFMADMLHIPKLQKAKVAVISVAGAFRKGKSFMLNFFLRFLRALSRGNTSNWIRSGEGLDGGFHWRSGSERDTAGVLIWSEPFFIRKPGGEEVAVLLVDTQGTFDHQSTQQDCTTIFAFSTLISSVQIFNISQNIQETDLQHLRLFVEFAGLAKTSTEMILQHLWFLIRDWQNPDEHEYGVAGGDMYLSKVLACDSGKPRENQELRQGIRGKFEQASCCLLPHPGPAVQRSAFRGEVRLLDAEFVREVESFVPRIVSAQSILTKKVNGAEITGNQLKDLLEIYFKAVCSERMPNPRGIFDATVQMASIAAAAEAKRLFEDRMQQLDRLEIDDRALREGLHEYEAQAVELFRSRCMEPQSAVTHSVEKNLKRDLMELQTRLRDLRQAQLEKRRAEQSSAEMSRQSQELERQRRDEEQKLRQQKEDGQRRLQELEDSRISREKAAELRRSMSQRLGAERRQAEQEQRRLEEQAAAQAEANRQLQAERQANEMQQRAAAAADGGNAGTD